MGIDTGPAPEGRHAVNKELLGMLYTRYSGELTLYLHALCGSWAMAEDLLQEVFLKAMLSLEDTHPNFKAWLFLVGKNLCRTRMAREGRTVPGPLPQCEAPQVGPLERLLEKQRDATLYRAVMALPEIQRQVIVLQYFSGLGQAQIAQVTGLSHGHVRVVAHRAKKQLKAMLEREETEEK